jgi:hypothetical protein
MADWLKVESGGESFLLVDSLGPAWILLIGVVSQTDDSSLRSSSNRRQVGQQLRQPSQKKLVSKILVFIPSRPIADAE